MDVNKTFSWYSAKYAGERHWIEASRFSTSKFRAFSLYVWGAIEKCPGFGFIAGLIDEIANLATNFFSKVEPFSPKIELTETHYIYREEDHPLIIFVGKQQRSPEKPLGLFEEGSSDYKPSEIRECSDLFAKDDDHPDLLDLIMSRKLCKFAWFTPSFF